MVRQYFVTLIFGILTSTLCSAATVGGFAYPGNKGPDLSIPWKIGDFKPIAWFSTLEDYNITLWQQDPPTLVGVVWSTSDHNGVGDKDYLWQVQTYSADTSVSSQYTLWGGFEIYHNSSSGFVSYGFKVTNEAVADPATATSSAVTTSATSSASTASTIPSGASSSDSTSTTTQASSHDDNTLKIGLGVGLGVGIPLVIAIGIFLGWMLFRRRGQRDEKPPLRDAQGFDAPRNFDSQYPPEYKINDSSPTPHQEAPPFHQVDRPDRPAELGASRGLSELSG